MKLVVFLLIWSFAVLCAAMFVSRAASWIFLVQLSHRVTFKLRLELSARILAAVVISTS